MAGKRRAVIDSDDEEQSQKSGSASKRARAVGFDSDPEIHYIPANRKKDKEKEKRKEKGKARADILGEHEEDEEENVPEDVEYDEEKDKKFEEEHTDRMRAAIEAKRLLQGSIAEYGIIESIEMHQFMCHKALTFKFGEQINFIIGHNGSGKSAVLTAITVALGGKANTTGRGSGLKALIREGQSAAEVTIQIKNQGDEAFKSKEYGKSIFITRRFNKEGASSWKIKSFDGKVVSTKKDELAAICDHMNIQVDNPMNVLTQDAARQFLAASSPGDKYKFFLRGTQLSQLSDEYDTCLENISQTTKALAMKKEAVPDLKAAFREASVRFEEASKARDQKKKADDLKKELAWAHVAAKESEMRKKFEELEKARRRLPKIQSSMDAAKSTFDGASQEITAFEAEHRELGDIGHLQARKQTVNDQIKENKRKITSFANDIKMMDQSMKATRQTIEEYQKRIDDETKKTAVQTQAKRDETVSRLEQTREDVQKAEQRLKDVLEQKRQKIADADGVKNEGLRLEGQATAAQKKVIETGEMIGKFNEKEKDNYIAYGRNMDKVLQEMKTIRWKGEVIGPLGVHVTVKEPEKWAPLLRSLLGSHMMSFAVTEPADREPLKALLRKYENPNVPIIIGKRDLFDYSRGEPPPNITTVLRVLEIDDPWVVRILINAANIERSILAPTRLEGEEILSKIGGGVAWTADMFRVTVFPEGGGASNLMNAVQARDPRRLLFTGRDVARDVARWKSELADTEQEVLTLRREEDRLKQTYTATRREIDRLSNEEREQHDTIRQLKVLRDSLQEEANSDLPVAVASLEAAKTDAITEKESIMQQFQELMERKAEVDRAQVPLIEQLKDIRAQVDEFEERRTAVTNKIEAAVQRRLEAQNSQNHYEKKLREEQGKVNDVERIANDLQLEFKDWTKEAEQFCERIPDPRSVEVVKRNFESVQKALEAREKKQGATVEEMTIEVNKAKANLDNALADLANMSKLNKALKRSLIIRLAKWQEFRRHIALRCKLVFQYHLAHRGYYGKVLFDHYAGTLQLKVQTEDKIGTQGPREKDPRALSGGEKSFATICLLLSLWDSIGCPLRCLDEFDVFMDAVNRKISLNLMIDTGTASDKKQYILITPLDMHNVKLGPTIRVNRMPDPERGQGILQRR